MKSFAAGAEHLDAFLELPERLYGSDPLWIRPLRQVDQRDLLGLGAFGGYAELQMILCEREGVVVGRCAAIHNPRLPGLGQIGYFEALNDPGIFPSMLEVARPWLAARGATSLIGPMNGGAHRLHRLMTRGFETAPFLFEPRNPAYYCALFEAVGFEPFHRWSSYELGLEHVHAFTTRLRKAVDRSLRTRSIVPFDLSDPAVMPRLHRLLDRVWEGHVGFAHIDLDEFVECYGGVLAINPPKYLGTITNAAGEDLALGLSYPDYAAEARALSGDASGWAAWVGGPLPERLVMHTMAAVPEERGGGAAILIVDHAGRCLIEDGFQGVIVALVTQELTLFDRFAKPTREYAIYRCPL